MSDKDDTTKKRRPLKSLPPDGFQPKTWLIWIAIIGAVAALYMFNPPKSAAPMALKIQQVVALAEAGKIAEGTIGSDASGGRDWSILRGETKEAILKGDGESGPTKSFVATGRLTDTNLERLQKSEVFTEKPATTAMTALLYNILPFLIVIGLLYFLFMRQIKQAGKGAMSFGKSRAKLLVREKDRITFVDVAGCDEAKEEVSEVVDFLKDPKKFQKIGGRIPRGIMMIGPPGTGKTLLAKAIAGEAEVPFFSISGSDFVEMFVGVGASRVRDMFEQGRKNAPCLIFIDEIDAVGRQRGAGLGGGNDEREQTLNSLLVEMDGFDTTEGVIIIAATNRPDVLDSALQRPGRFDRQVYIDLPDIVGREQILRVHARKIALGEDVDLALIARGTPGLSGAELANLLNEAALLAARRNKKKVDMTDVEEARHKVLFGRERRKVMDDEDKKIVAYHEAGHALVSAVIHDDELPVHKVTIITRGLRGTDLRHRERNIVGEAGGEREQCGILQRQVHQPGDGGKLRFAAEAGQGERRLGGEHGRIIGAEGVFGSSNGQKNSRPQIVVTGWQSELGPCHAGLGAALAEWPGASLAAAGLSAGPLVDSLGGRGVVTMVERISPNSRSS